MKFSIPGTLFTIAAAVDAAAVQEDKRWCSTPGQACWTVKRAAEAFADAIQSDTKFARDESDVANMAKRQTDELGVIIATSLEDAKAYYESLALDKRFELDDKTKREPEADPWCNTFKGQPCWKAKREAEPGPWCNTFKGQPCWKAKREAEPWCDTFKGQPCWKAKRAPSDPEYPAEVKARCLSDGQSCFKAKRAAEAVVSAIESSAAHDPRHTPFDPQARVKREADPWCNTFKGQPCWKREAEAMASCNAPGGACAMAQRDLHAIYNAARSILDAASAE
ncbi:hypothetical protein B0T26DRAFT_746370 [Lasiosphaeria miniovina]|uniref:Clock-controlled pheromone ccg-4 n=1 Tax=Lasiosphaeria miniovina TaxID=1954250 RepID=A0AA40BHV1_9PEZI|nr:uncharacterized protein B0T26DRAFT_746370 [Lasiosphaeria miniovina]KAK0734470.1 hypothetical protein B0T26DRAFT_746370 [Lasiosphaeria miniovina]